MKQLVLVTQSCFSLFICVILTAVMLLANEIQAGEFPKSARGSDNPEITWTMNGDELRLVLGWKSDYDQTLNIVDVFADEEGHLHVKAETSCHGCYIRLYRKDGDSWNKLDEKKAEANTTYTLSAVVKTPSSEFPRSVSGAKNPCITWTTDEEEFMLVLGWKSDYDQALNIEDASMDEQGYINVKAKTSCHGCIMRLYRKEGDSWTKLDEEKAHAHETYTLRGLVKAAGVGFPQSVSGPDNPQITWTMDGQEFRLVLGWRANYDQVLSIKDAFTDEQGFINVNAETSCHGCIMRLYKKEGDAWNKLDEKKAHAHERYTLRGLVRTAGPEFPKSVRGSKNPHITWTMDEEEFMLVLGWKSDYDQTLNIQEASIDDEGFINVKADTSCHGCYIRLYRREGDTWNKLGEKKAHAGETYLLRNFAR